uniref:Uncharacterized protein isoform X2 n=1 Tax=Pogona vitticeps TaxID=103695 RepID=A0ABM5FLU3_9SAUR
MAPKKGGANKKGKQPAKRKATPQVSPPQSSSDEESWPIWKQLQEKISALEAEKMATQLRQDGDYQPRRSTRDSSGHRRAKLKALASDLMERFNVLEADRGTRRNEMTESAGESSVFKSRHLERISDVSLPATPANPEIPDGSEDIVGIPQDTEADSCPSTSMDGLVQGVSPPSQGVARSVTRGGLGDWREDAAKAIGLALAPRTRKGYAAV